MAEVELRIHEDAEALARNRAEALMRLLADKPDAVLLLNTGNTPRRIYEICTSSGLDLSRARIRLLDGLLLHPRGGFTDLDHPGCFTRYIRKHLLGPLPPPRRPRDWVLPPEDLCTCEEIEKQLSEDPDSWSSPPHPETGDPGSEIRIADHAGGILGRVRRACEAYESLLAEDPPDLANLGVGPMPYPHMAFNDGPWTRFEAETHLTRTSDSTREALAPAFGGKERVPPFALTAGPRSILRAREIWITAIGSSKAEAVARAFADPSAEEAGLGSSIGYALKASRVSLHLDEDAAEHLTGEGGLAALKKRYRAAGHRLDARRV